ncbi:MAG: prolipoprotein diacylglyceryl transferase [Isosphaerales bacterium]
MRQVLFTIPIFGGLSIFGYGTMLVLAFLSSTWLAWWRARRECLDPEIIMDMAFWVFLFGMVGARVFFCIEYWGTEIKNWWEVFQYWKGGIVFYGGLIGAIAGFFVYRRSHPFPLRPYMDVLAPSIGIGIMFGRLGCFLNGCCYGRVCQLPWAVSFPKPSPPWDHHHAMGMIPEGAIQSLPIHPTQIYFAIDGLVLLLLLSAFFPLRRRDGEVMGLLMLAYPISRFLIEFLRNDEGAFFAGLTISQTISVAFFLVGLAFWAWLFKQPDELYRDQFTASQPPRALMATAPS